MLRRVGYLVNCAVTDLHGNKENHNTSSYMLHVVYMCWVLKSFVDRIIKSPVKRNDSQGR